MQESNTRHMLFKVHQLVSFLSRNFTLVPGDVILTGTPHGVGAFRQPSVYMNDGDEIVIEIEKIGRLVNTCKTQPVPIP
jgi:2-keto-4-pentenoate hydratase/2-oxohepta-3-ene-1,7-dioic acid hydratase in catechol pathway